MQNKWIELAQETLKNARRLPSMWSYIDIEEKAKDMGIKLTDEQVDKVMKYIVDSFNAEIGINWDVIEMAINEIHVPLKKMPNGLESFSTTQYYISDSIFDEINREGSVHTSESIAEKTGTDGLHDLVYQLTNEFENKFEGASWGEDLVFLDEVEQFLKDKVFN